MRFLNSLIAFFYGALIAGGLIAIIGVANILINRKTPTQFMGFCFFEIGAFVFNLCTFFVIFFKLI